MTRGALGFWGFGGLGLREYLDMSTRFRYGRCPKLAVAITRFKT